MQPTFLPPLLAAAALFGLGPHACAVDLSDEPSAEVVSPVSTVDEPANSQVTSPPDRMVPRTVAPGDIQDLEARRVPAGKTTQGCLQFSDDDGTFELPLLDTRVQADISGTVAVVEVTQLFHNPSSAPIEAIYSLPLPDDGAVDAMTIVIGARIIEAEIRREAEARQLYEAARDNGQTAALLEQERPNIFTQSVANILPQETIEVIVSVVAPLHYEDGRYSWHFPMTIGPRFSPGGKSVPDVAEITPPVASEGRSGHDIHLEVNLETAVEIAELGSSTHDISVEPQGAGGTFVELESHDTIPNRDFELSWEVSGFEPATGILSHSEAHETWFSLMVEPPVEWGGGIVVPKEMVFVIDGSCSMRGEPMDKAKALVRHALRNLNPEDTFQIIRFSEAASALGQQPLANTPANVKAGLRYIDGLHGMGGTQMVAGIKAALDYPVDPERLRQVLFLTDGYIGNEVEILSAIEHSLGDTRLFSLGLGSSPNRYLLERMARSGRGTVQYALPDEDEQEVVELFYERIRNPLLRNIKLDWGDLSVEEVTPELVPDLYAGQPIQVWGRTRDTGPATVTLRAQLGRDEVELEVELDLREDATNPGLRSMWARQQIEDRMALMVRGETDQLREEVIELSLRHGVMSQWTSFVAIDEEARTAAAGASTHIPNELPEGMLARSEEGVNMQGLGSGRSSSVTGLVGAASGYGHGGIAFDGRGTGSGGGGSASTPGALESFVRGRRSSRNVRGEGVVALRNRGPISGRPNLGSPDAAEGRRAPGRRPQAEALVAEPAPAPPAPPSEDPESRKLVSLDAPDHSGVEAAAGGRVSDPSPSPTVVSVTFGDESVKRELTRRLRSWKRHIRRGGGQPLPAGTLVVIDVAFDAQGNVALSLASGSAPQAEAFLNWLRTSGALELDLASAQGSLTLQF